MKISIYSTALSKEVLSDELEAKFYQEIKSCCALMNVSFHHETYAFGVYHLYFTNEFGNKLSLDEAMQVLHVFNTISDNLISKFKRDALIEVE